MKILALDIGGANTKMAILDDRKLEESSFYFPFWKRRNNFYNFLKGIVRFPWEFDAVGITMTAELSDAFQTRSEGVQFILNTVGRVFSNKVLILSINENFLTLEEAFRNPLMIASANWVATSWYLGKKFGTGILVDIGSTTTDIIPVKDGRILIEKRSDLDRLQNNELLYAGVLRTNIATITDSVPVDGIDTRITSELFAITADVYSILGDISEGEYMCETPDSRSKELGDCEARISRIVCSDVETLSKESTHKIAEFIKERQIDKISECIKKISEKCKIENVFVCGAGTFLAEEAAKKAGIRKIKKLNISTASALAMMVAEKLERLPCR